MVLGDHSGQEFANHPEMRHGIHLEGFLNHPVIASKNCCAGTDSGIVDQDRGVTMISADLCCDGRDLRLRGYVGLIEIDVGCCRVSNLALAQPENRASVRFQQDDQGLKALRSGSLGALMSITTTLTPFSANCFAINCPMPEHPPVISTTS